MAQPAHVKAFVVKFADAARQVETTYGLNPLTTLAQAAIESGWEWNGGGGQTAKSRKNYFGLGGDATLRTYSSPLDSFLDYGKLLTSASRYQSAVAAGYDIEKFCMAIGHSGYKAGTWAQKNKYALDLAWIAKNRIAPLYPYTLGQSSNSASNSEYTTEPVIITANSTQTAPPSSPKAVILPPKKAKKKFPIVPVVIGGTLLVGGAAALYFYNRSTAKSREQELNAAMAGLELHTHFVFPFWAKVAIGLGVFTVGTAIVVYAAKKKDRLPASAQPIILPENATTTTVTTNINTNMSTLSTNGMLSISDVSINNVVDSLPKHKSKRYKGRNLSQIKYIVLHHSAGTPSESATSMANYHVKKHKWAGIGYHFVIEANGAILQTNPITSVSNHVAEFNTPCIGICFPGNFDINDNVPTDAQVESGKKLIAGIMAAMGRNLEIVGHKEVARPGNSTACPGRNFPFSSFR